LKKKLRDDLTLFIGIGGNIGDTKKIFDKLILSLKGDSRFDLLITSPLLLNPPFGYLEQNEFLNGIIILKTNLSPNEFLKNMNRLEKRFGRKRSFQDAPRTLDIDIIFFDNKKINTKKLIIPHKDWANRESVLIPLKHL
jgi:2-amino-4-hydroxy-6-hydroxymethyldihydropteridine diphosphokinase